MAHIESLPLNYDKQYRTTYLNFLALADPEWLHAQADTFVETQGQEVTDVCMHGNSLLEGFEQSADDIPQGRMMAATLLCEMSKEMWDSSTGQMGAFKWVWHNMQGPFKGVDDADRAGSVDRMLSSSHGMSAELRKQRTRRSPIITIRLSALFDENNDMLARSMVHEEADKHLTKRLTVREFAAVGSLSRLVVSQEYLEPFKNDEGFDEVSKIQEDHALVSKHPELFVPNGPELRAVQRQLALFLDK